MQTSGSRRHKISKSGAVVGNLSQLGQGAVRQVSPENFVRSGP